MHNPDLIKDYLFRAGNRLKAVQLLFDCESFADVVRESQEVIELCLKALLRKHNIEAPRVHDVSQVLMDNESQFSAPIRIQIKKLAKISRSLRRDRELSYYGSEDLTPSEFYKKDDGKEALDSAKFVYNVCVTVLD